MKHDNDKLKDLYRLRAEAMSRDNNNDVIRITETIISCGDKDAQGLKLNLAIAYYNRGCEAIGDDDKAIADYTKAIEMRPNFVMAYNNRAMTHYRKGNYDNAIADFTRLIMFNLDISGFYYRGNCYDRKGDYDSAISDFSRVIKLQPNDADAYFNRATCHGKKSNYDLSIADFTRAIELSPDDAESYYYRGIGFENKKKYFKGLQDFTRALKMHPDDARALYHRGNCHYHRTHYTQAIADYTRAIEVKDNYIEAFSHRGMAYFQRGNCKKAVEDFSKVISLQPNDPTAYYSRGICYSRLGNYDKSIADLSRAIELRHDESIAYFNRAGMFSTKGEGFSKQAISDYTQGINLSISRLRANSQVVYKYRPLNKNTVDSLVNNTLYLSNPNMNEDPMDTPILTTSENKALLEALEGVHLTSLSVVRDNAMMWRHYSENHKGVCIGYKFSDNFLDKHNLGIEKVGYSKSVKFEKEGFGDALCSYFFTKFSGWKYEKEVRLLAFQEEKNSEGVLLNLEQGSVRSITFGIKCPQSEREKIMARCLSLSHLSQISFFEVQVDSKDSFAIKIVPMKINSKLKNSLAKIKTDREPVSRDQILDILRQNVTPEIRPVEATAVKVSREVVEMAKSSYEDAINEHNDSKEKDSVSAFRRDDETVLSKSTKKTSKKGSKKGKK